MPQVDLFLSYNSSDREVAFRLKTRLQAEGLTTFLDRENLPRGLSWSRALEEALRNCRAVGVLVGRDGLGPFQMREVEVAIARQALEEAAGRSFVVAPILLPGSDPPLGFLTLNSWIDLRDSASESTEIHALVASVRAVQQGVTERPVRSPLQLICPFRGLATFREEDAAFFLGRDAPAQTLLRAVLDFNGAVVIGSSGVGKSSLVFAGLVPRLRQTGPPQQLWEVATCQPGDSPFHRLAAALMPVLDPALTSVARLEDGRRLGHALQRGTVRLSDVVDTLLLPSHGADRALFVIDQFEELFTISPVEIRRPFIEALLGLSPRASVVLTMRADFYSYLLNVSPLLLQWLPQRVVNLGPMEMDGLEMAIAVPAARVDLTFEPGLVRRILTDVGREPGGLALMEYALTELWNARRGSQLTHQAYDEIGGVEHALQWQADRIFLSLAERERAGARRLLSRLVRVGAPEDGTQDTRRRVAIRDLDADSEGLLPRFASASSRLLVTSRDPATGLDVVELAHEALIRAWPPLRSWLDHDREFLLWRQRLGILRDEAQRAPADPELLLRGNALLEALRWHAERPDDLLPPESAFILQSMTASRRASRRRFVVRAALSLGTLMSAVLLAVLWLQAGRAERSARDGRVASLTAEYLRQAQAGHSDLGIALLAAAARLDPYNDEVRARLFWELSRLRACLPTAERTVAGSLSWARLAPDERRAVVIGTLGQVEVVDMVTGRPAMSFSPGAPCKRSLTPLLSPDGRFLVIGCEDGLRLWDLHARKPITVPYSGPIIDVAFRWDARTMATACGDGFVRVWDPATGALVVSRQASGPLEGVSYSPDGRGLVIGPRHSSADVLAATESPLGLRSVGRLEDSGTAAFLLHSPDGRLVAAAGRRGDVTIWDATSLAKVGVLSGGGASINEFLRFDVLGRVLAVGKGSSVSLWRQEGSTWRRGATITDDGGIRDLDFNPSGDLVATTSGHDLSRLWSVQTGRPVGPALGRGDRLVGVQFCKSTRRLFTASAGGRLRLWSVRREASFGLPLPHLDRVAGIAFADGGGLAVTAAGSNAYTWDTRSGQWGRALRHPSRVRLVELDSSGELVLSATEDALFLWDTRKGILKWGPVAQPNAPIAALVDAVTRTIECVDAGGRWVALDVMSSALIAQRHLNGRVLAARRGTRGLVVATATGADQVQVTRTGGGVAVEELRMPGLRRLWLGPLGHQLLAEVGGQLELWNLGDSSPSTRVLRTAAPVLSADFDGKGVLATGLGDKSVWLWSTKTGELLRRPLVQAGRPIDLRFSGDGKRLLCLLGTEGASVWDVASGADVWPGRGSFWDQGGFAGTPNRLYLVEGSRVWLVDALVGTSLDAEVLASLAEGASGFRATESGSLASVSDPLARLLEVRHNVRVNGGPISRLFVEWFFAEGAAETISPLARISHADYIARLSTDVWVAGVGERAERPSRLN